MAGEKDGPRGFTLVDEPGATPPKASDPPGAPPDLSFATLLLSLSASALVHMGIAPEPGRDVPGAKNLGLARQTIDVLEILKTKTKGNLDEGEARLLETVLRDLQLRYLEARRAG